MAQRVVDDLAAGVTKEYYSTIINSLHISIPNYHNCAP